MSTFLTVSSWQCGVERQAGNVPDVPEVGWLDEVRRKGAKTNGEGCPCLLPTAPCLREFRLTAVTRPQAVHGGGYGPLVVRGLQSCGWGQIAKGQEPCGDEGHSSSLTGGF